MTSPFSEYMEWAKTRSGARFNLASSGVAAFPLADLPVRLEDLEIGGDSAYGYAPLQERLARKAGVDPDRVVHATGTSMANLLVLAAAAQPGDEVLIEAPTYSLLVDAARWLRLDVRRFPRRAGEGFRVDPREVERALTPRTRLVVLTNLHNPSSAFTPPEDLRAVGDAARSVGGRVLVDEVYLESLAVLGRPTGSAAHLGPEFVVTSSLTKAYGLSGLRCGWAVADPDLARRMWRLNDLFGVIPAHPAERLSVVALDHLDRVAARARGILEANADGANAFLAARPDLAGAPVDGGMIAFPRLVRGDVEALCQTLRERHETTVVPGRFFGAPDHFRLSLGGLPETFAGGLLRLARALDEGPLV
ncbi:MAG TPA: pyridoxal phosphate-dependent aminotransferase [Vicinamibacteria bacterium]